MDTCSEVLRLVRIPGELGPILRCFGELSGSATEALERELDLLEPLNHSALIVNLSGCSFVGSPALLALLYCSRRRRRRGRHLLVVAGAGPVVRRLEQWRFHQLVPVFSTEEAAMLAIRGGPSAAPPPTWAMALAEAVVHWDRVRLALDQGHSEEALRLLTAMTPLCERSEELFREGSLLASSRCEFCPLFYERGGQEEDVGCAGLLAPILAAVRAGDDGAARAQVAAAVRTMEELLLVEADALSGALPASELQP